MKAILYKDGVEQRRDNYPDVEMRLIDLPSGYEWKLLIDDVKPNYNQHLERLVRTEVDNDVSNVDYPHLKQIDVVYNIVRKSDEEITKQLIQQEDNANQSLLDYSDRLKTMVLYMAILNRKIDGGNITQKMQNILDKVDAKAIKLWQNDTNLKAKLAELANGQDPDINNGWTNE